MVCPGGEMDSLYGHDPIRCSLWGDRGEHGSHATTQKNPRKLRYVPLGMLGRDISGCVGTLEFLNVIPDQVVIPGKFGIRKARSVENTAWPHPIGITQASLHDPI